MTSVEKYLTTFPTFKQANDLAKRIREDDEETICKVRQGARGWFVELYDKEYNLLGTV